MELVLIGMLHRIVPGARHLTGSELAKIVAFLTAAATVLGTRLAEEALASVAALGIPLSGFSMASFAGYAARLQWEKLSALGLTRLDKPILHQTAKVKAFLKKNPHAANADDLLNMAFFRDTVVYTLRHFTLIRKLAAMLATPGMLETLSIKDAIAPYSDAAVQCISAVGGISYGAIKTRGIALEPVSIEDLLKEEFLTADEAARVMRLAPKTLEDMCRDGRVPNAAYVRHAKNGSYRFLTAKLRALAESGAWNPKKNRR